MKINKQEVENLIEEWKRDNSESRGFTQHLKIDFSTLKIDGDNVSVEFWDKNDVHPEHGEDEGTLNFQFDGEEIDLINVDIF